MTDAADIDPDRLERVARMIAAIKMGLIKDIYGDNLPEDLWRQAIPEARRRIEASDDIEHAPISDAEKLARAVLLFHRGGSWTEHDHEMWIVLTGQHDATTKTLCDLARKVRAAEETPNHAQARLMDEITRLRTGLNEVRDFLNKPEWGTYPYMEGSDVHNDKEAALFNISYALGETDAA
jgi:hypothetical protein